MFCTWLTCHRPQHARLNQLIFARLPLALPPHSLAAQPYAQGLLRFASIYHAFESAWRILSEYEPASELPLETAVILSSLIHLHIPELARSDRLEEDLSLLLDAPRSEIADRIRHPVSQRTCDFVNHIRDVARNRPHALIAYSWVLYMALFNGGRWIREQLTTARDISWFPLSESAVELSPEDNSTGLSFWYFDSDEDGDDIKADFSARLSEVGSMFSTDQKEDIIDEAKTVFERCAEMIEELDHTQQKGANELVTEDETSSWSGLYEFLRLLLPMVVMQLLVVLLKRISGIRVRAPLPFRKLEKKEN